MATREIEEWSKVDAQNDFTADEGGWVENMKRSDVNDAARADMGAMRRWYDDPEWLNLTVNAGLEKVNATTLKVLGGDFRTYFTPNRRVKITGGTPSTVYATVDPTNSADINGGDTDVTLTGFSGHTEIPTTPTLCTLHIAPSLNPSVFSSDNFVTVTTLTGVAIQAAIDTLEAADGGIILLEPNATYLVDATIVIGGGANPGNIRFIGRGATLRADTDLNDDIINVDDVGTLYARLVFEELIFDGNATNQSAGTDKGLIAFGTNVFYVWIRDCQFFDSYNHEILFSGQASHIWIEDSEFGNTGEDCIHIEDPTSSTDSFYISRCTFGNPALEAATTGAGIYFEGQLNISDCLFRGFGHATDNQIGIHMAPKVAASPFDQSAHNSVITGCIFEGTGLNARGIWLQGRENIISACSFRLSGSGSEAIQADDTVGGRESNLHVISGCNIYGAARAIRFFSTAEDIIVTGCKISNATYPYTDGGTRNKFSSNHIDTCTDGVTLEATADDAMISENRIDSASSKGIVITAGASEPQVYLNSITNSSGVDIADGSTDGIVIEAANFYHRSLLVDAAGTTPVDLDVENQEYGLPGSEILIDSYADGVREWVINHIMMTWQATSHGTDTTDIVRFRVGTNRAGDPSLDTLVGFITYLSGNLGDAGTFNHVWIPMVFTPSLNDEIYVSCERDGAGGIAYDHDVSLEGSDEQGAGSTYWEIGVRKYS
jgi:hypothetical protein